MGLMLRAPDRRGGGEGESGLCPCPCWPSGWGRGVAVPGEEELKVASGLEMGPASVWAPVAVGFWA